MRNPDMALRSFYTQLNATMRAPHAPFPMYDGTREPLEEYGVAYYRFPKKRGKSPWFKMSQYAAADRRAATRQGVRAQNVGSWFLGYLIHWPDFLWQARVSPAPSWEVASGELEGAAEEEPEILDLFSGSLEDIMRKAREDAERMRAGLAAPPKVQTPAAKVYTPHYMIQPLARRLLRLLQPLVAQFDVILARDILLFEKRWTLELPYSRERPAYFGAKSAEDEERFDTHLRALLQDAAFREHVEKTLRASLRNATALTELETLGACPSSRNHRGREAICPHCAPYRWVRWNTSLLEAEAFDSPTLLRRSIQWELSSPDYFHETTNPGFLALRTLLAAQPFDGVVRVEENGAAVLVVNYAKLVALAETQEEVKSLFLVDDYSPRSDLWLRGSLARRALEAAYPHIISALPTPLSTRVAAEGWEWRDTLDLPYGHYRVSNLVRRLTTATALVRRLLRGRAQPRERIVRRVPVTQEVLLDYPAGLTSTTIRCIRRRRRNHPGPELLYYTLPYEVPEADENILSQNTALAVTVRGTRYWSRHGVHAHAELRDRYGVFLCPAAVQFVQWLSLQEQELTPQKFKALLYTSRYGERVAAVKAGKRRMGRFVPPEDQAIEAFLRSRPRMGPLADAEWSVLLDRLPGRNQASVRTRIIALGKIFAFEQGWVAYTNSYWCLQRSQARRKRWKKEGMRD